MSGEIDILPIADSNVDSGVIAARIATVPERYRPSAERAAEWLASWT